MMIDPHVHVVRFSEVDAAGVVFFSRFFELCHHAWEEVLAAALGPRWFDAMAGSGWGLPLIHAEADFRRPARLGDRLTVRIAGVALDGSGRLRVRFAIEGADDLRHASVEHVHAFVDLARFRPIAAPPAFLARLGELGLEAGGE